MPYPEVYVESSLPPLGSALRAAIEDSSLTDFLRRSLQIREPRCAPGLPRRVSDDADRRWLNGPHVFVQLGSGAQYDAVCCEVALPVEQAVELVDRVLGGGGRGLVPGRAGKLSAAECGVLAYFAARCVRACGVELRVQDVGNEPFATALEGSVIWPVRVRTSDQLKLDLKLIYRHESSYPMQRVSVRLAFLDHVSETLLAELQDGDLLVSDAWSLHMSATGPTALLELSVLGSEERALMLLEAGALRHSTCALPGRAAEVRSPTREPNGQSAELVLAELVLSFGELADLLGTGSVPCPAPSEARLVLQGRTRAGGRLVQYAGQLALQVDKHLTPPGNGSIASGHRA